MAEAAELEPAGEMARDRLLQMILGYQISQCLHVVAKLGIADLLVTGPKSVGELAAATGTEPTALGRLLRALTCHGVFTSDDREQFSLNPTATLLCSRAPHTLHSAAVYWGEGWMWEPWGHLAHSLRAGAPAFDDLHSANFFDFLRRRSVRGRYLSAVSGNPRLERRARTQYSVQLPPGHESAGQTLACRTRAQSTQRAASNGSPRSHDACNRGRQRADRRRIWLAPGLRGLLAVADPADRFTFCIIEGVPV